MDRDLIAILSVGALVLCSFGDATSQTIPGKNSPKSDSQLQPTMQAIATGNQRISRDPQTAVVFQGNRIIRIDYFTEVVIGTMNAEKPVSETLEGDTVSLTRDAKQKDRWIVFRGGASDGDSLIMAENVFRVQRVLTSTAQNPVKIQLNGRVYRLQPGEILLLLG